MGNTSSSNVECEREYAGVGMELPSLLFHEVHGENVKLFKNRREARRVESFCKGLAFSQRPIGVNEIVCIRFSEVATNWSGVLRFGLTNCNPTSLRDSLPKFACPDLTNKPGNWAKALHERYCQSGHILHFSVSDSGEVLYGINGTSKGVFLSGVDTSRPLYIVVDIYGNSTAVEFVDPNELPSMRSHVRNLSGATGGQHHGPVNPVLNNQRSAPAHVASSPRRNPQQEIASELSSRLSMDSAQARPEVTGSAVPRLRPPAGLTSSASNVPSVLANVDNSCRYYIGNQLQALEFHSVHGRNVTVPQNDKSVACRAEQEYHSAYVFTSRHMALGEKVLIKILNIQEAYAGGIAFGLTTCNPVLLGGVVLPEDSDLLLDRPEYWLVKKDVAAGPRVGDELMFYISLDGSSFHLPPARRTLPAEARHDPPSSGAPAIPIPKSRPPPTTVRQPQQRPASALAVSDESNSPAEAPGAQSQSGGNSPWAINNSHSSPSFPVNSNTRVSRYFPAITSSMDTAPSSTTSASTTATAESGSSSTASAFALGSIGSRLEELARGPGFNPFLPPSAQSCNPTTGNPPSVPTSRALPRTTGSCGDLEEETDECVICMSEGIDSVVYRCGHMCMCHNCAQQQLVGGRLCPICRQEIIDVVKVFKS